MKTIIYLERHDMNHYLASPFALENGEVFEDNTLRWVNLENTTYFVSIVSNNRVGAKVAFVELNNDKLTLTKSGPAIGTGNRWISPLVKSNKIFANKTPHIGGDIFEYTIQNNAVIEKSIGSFGSFHDIGENKLATADFANDFLYTRARNRKQLVEKNLKTNESTTKNFDNKITDISAYNKEILVLLSNGDLYFKKILK